MHIVSRRNMLALPVERLVGNSNQHGHHRPPMTMSPDSSDSSNSDSHSPTTPNAKVFSSYASQLLTNNSPSPSPTTTINVNTAASPPHPASIINSIHNNELEGKTETPTPPQSPKTPKPIMTSVGVGVGNCLISSTSESEPVKIKMSPNQSPSNYNEDYEDSNSNSRYYSFGDSSETPQCDENEEENEGRRKRNKGWLMTGQTKRMALLSNKDKSKEGGERLEMELPAGHPCCGSDKDGGLNKRRDEGCCKKLKSQNYETSASSSCVMASSHSQKIPIRIIEDDVGVSCNNSLNSKVNNVQDDSSDENNSFCGRPPSRTPSSSSSTTSTFPSISPRCHAFGKDLNGSKIILSTNNTLITRPQQLHHHLLLHRNGNGNSLKFSIDDILRPEFGKVAIQRIERRSSVNSSFSGEFSSSDSSPYNHPCHNKDPNNESNSSHSPHNPPATSTSSHDEHGNKRHSRGPSSVKDHSEDSNSSCTSRREEVVDETKVNPKVPQGPLLWPAWVYCTRYSDRPSSGPRSRRVRKRDASGEPGPVREQPEEKRPRTAFTADQLQRLKQEFDENRYLTEKRRQDLARDLKLHENQIKIWFQNKRAKLKKSSGSRNGLALQLMAQGLYNHSTVPIDEDDEMYEAMMQQQ